MAPDPWHEILEIALRAPSPHNVQPWRIRIQSNSEADLCIDKSRTLPKEDLSGSFIILTMGMFIESIAIVAANRGYRLQYTLHAQPGQFTSNALSENPDLIIPFARLQITPDDDIGSTYPDELFHRRRTSRIPFKPDTVPDLAATILSGLARESAQRYEQITDRHRIERILSWNTEALFADLNSRDYHDEITMWFRYSDSEAQHHRDGLDYRCMNASPFEFRMLARLPKLLQLPLLRSVFARRYRRLIGPVSTLGLLAGGFWRPEDAFQTGRFLMRFWLETARHGLFIHPYGNLVTNHRASDKMLKETGIKDIWLVFKIGFSETPPKSHRRPLEDVLLD